MLSPLLLSLIAGMGTLLGGIIFLVLIQQTSDQVSTSITPLSNSLYAHLQAASAGCMILLSLDLYLLESLPAIGLFSATLYFIGGFGLFAGIQRYAFFKS
jgi:zinc transporter ZupT